MKKILTFLSFVLLLPSYLYSTNLDSLDYKIVSDSLNIIDNNVKEFISTRSKIINSKKNIIFNWNGEKSTNYIFKIYNKSNFYGPTSIPEYTKFVTGGQYVLDVTEILSQNEKYFAIVYDNNSNEVIHSDIFEVNYPECSNIDNLRFYERSENGYHIDWTYGDKSTTARFEIRYKNTNSLEWIYDEVLNSNEYTISNVNRDLDYDVQVQRICNFVDSKFEYKSRWIGLEIESYRRDIYNCSSFVDTMVLYGNIGMNDIEVKWTYFPAILLNPYRCRIWQVDTSGIGLLVDSVIVDSGNSYTFQNLLANTEYYADVTLYETDKEMCAEVHQLPNVWTLNAPFSLPDVGCGDDISNNEGLDSTLITDLQANNIIYANLFPIQLTELTMSNNKYSGKGILKLPIGGRKIPVTFSNIEVNINFKIVSGVVVSHDTGSQALQDLIQPISIGGAICVEPPLPVVGYWENSIWMPQGTLYDPYGFNQNGEHFSTNSLYNENGCSVNSLDSLGNPCPMTEDPFYWVNSPSNGPTPDGFAFAQALGDTIQDFIILSLDSLDGMFIDSIDLYTTITSDIRLHMLDLTSQLSINQPNYLFGPNNKYINLGMSQEFESQPRKLGVFIESRDARIDSIEFKHVELYGNDQIYIKNLILDSLTINQRDEVHNLENLRETIFNKIASFSETQIAQFSNSKEMIKSH